MKKISVLLAVLSLLIPIYVQAQSTLALQQKCAEGAKKFYKEEEKIRTGIAIFYNEHHYNKKLDRCFLQVGYH
jgi:hypothetical protein